MLKKILIYFSAIVVLIVIIGFLLPSNVHVEKSIEINKSPMEVYEIVNGFKEFNNFSPWASIDPKNTKYEFTGNETGVGSKMSWKSSNPDVGNGKQVVLENELNKKVKIRIEFEGMGNAISTWNLEDINGKTKATWQFDSDMGQNIFMKYIGFLVMGTSVGVGGDYEKGLANLKKYAEAKVKTNLKVSFEEVKSMNILVVSDSCMMDVKEIGNSYSKAYSEINSFIQKSKLTCIGAPFAIMDKSTNEKYHYTAGMPISESNVKSSGRLKFTKSYSGKVLKVIHTGAYSQLEKTYTEILNYIKENKLNQNGKMWEVYVSDPGNTPESNLITEVYVPLK